MQGTGEEAKAQYIRLFEAAEGQLKEAYNHLQKQKMKQEMLKSEYEAELTKKHELKMRRIRLFNEIETQKQRVITQNKLLLSRAESKLFQLVKVQNLAKQEPSTIKMPSIQMDFKELEEPKNLEEVVQEYNRNFQKQKAILEQEIMKLRIVIRLNQIKQEEGTFQTSKSKKSQTSNHPKK